LKVDALRKALKALPKTLDETYARILDNINEEYSQDAFRILQWLVYSARPLRIEEIAEVLAINTDESRFDPENRLPEPRDLLTICSSLVTTVVGTVKDNKGASNETTELRLAHFSVKEYLISDRIRKGAAFQYDIQSRAEEEIVQTCLTYLFYFQKGVLNSENLNIFPLALYVAKHWCRHFRAMDSDQAIKLGMQLFQGDTFINWIRLCNPDKPWKGTDIERNITSITSPLYYVLLEGLFKIVSKLLEKGADINTQGRDYSNTLYIASTRGHETIAVLLLEKGADINTSNKYSANVLYIASDRGYKALVVLLLEKGADINTQGELYSNTLQVASAGGYKTLVVLLLEKGADINTQGGHFSNALQAASAEGYEALIVLLLEKGADINT
jgi:hypothetical protein